jgi:RNA polymerase subunit RPABC4/transcription elongation factor Spt4
MSRMTSCRACGGMIAANATTCPRCGAVLNRTSIIPVGLVRILVIAVSYVLSQRYWLNPD